MSKQERKLSDVLDMAKSTQGNIVSDDLWRQKLEAFLSAQNRIVGPVEITDIKTPRYGSSSGKVIFSATAGFGNGRETKKMFLRYTLPKGLFGSYHCNIPWQYAVQKALHNANLPVAQPLYIDASGTFLDHPAYVMEFLSGRVASEDHFHSDPIASATPAERREIMLNIVRFLAKAHAIDWRAQGLGFLMHRGDGETCVERDFNWYVTAAYLLRPDLSDLMREWQEWMVANQPAERSVVFCHLDSHLGNHMFEENGTGLISAMDFEMSGLNQPEADLAYLGIVCENMSRGEKIDGIPTTAELFDEYERLTGYTCKNHDFWRTYSLGRMSIIYRIMLRHITLEQQEETRPTWGWWEDKLLQGMAR